MTREQNKEIVHKKIIVAAIIAQSEPLVHTRTQQSAKDIMGIFESGATSIEINFGDVDENIDGARVKINIDILK